MRMPITALTRNLLFTDKGTIWAMWRVDGQAYGLAATKMKLAIKRLHEEFFQSLRGEAVLSGVTASVDPASIGEAMVDGLDLDRVPRWCEEVSATLDMLEDFELGNRSYWLAVPLKSNGPKEAATRMFESAATALKEWAAFPRSAPAPQLVDAALRQAALVERALPSKIKARPVTPAETYWYLLHQQQRGLSLDPVAPDGPSGVASNLDDDQEFSPRLDPWIDRGAQTDTAEENKDRIYQRKYLKIVARQEPSYQALAYVSSMPKGGFTFPGGEWMAAVNELPFPVDWSWRMRITSARVARAENSKNESRLNDQYNQRTDTGITGSQAELDVHAQDLHEFQKALGRSEREVKISVAPVFVVAGTTAEEAKKRSEVLQEFYRNMDVELEIPLAAFQEDLWWSMVPGVPLTGVLQKHMLETTSFDLAGAIPLATSPLGTNKGILLGLNRTEGLPAAVLHDIDGAVTGNRSGSFAVCAELGAGKTFILKSITGAIVDLGGRFVAIDRSATREWAFFGQAISSSITVDVVYPKYSIDPLRVFGLEDGAEQVESMAAMLMGIAPTDPHGITLHEVLTPGYLKQHGLRTLSEVVGHLNNGCELPEAADLGRRMSAFASRSLGRVIFDDTLPALPLDARGIVFCTYGTELPTPNELASAHLFRQLSLQKIFGRALYAMIATLAYKICFADKNDLALFMASEAHHLTSNPQGEEIVNAFLREGRRAKAVIGLDSHDPEEFGPKRGLIPTRILMRQPDRDLAAKGLEWFGHDPKDEEMLELVQGFSPMGADNKVLPGREGEGLMQDMAGNIGEIQVTPPAVPERFEAVKTTPEAMFTQEVPA